MKNFLILVGIAILIFGIFFITTPKTKFLSGVCSPKLSYACTGE